ncbi:Integrase, catalytic core [Gossypium australe]|uniref:Integrase, catalytic core n=1 Tax=Gossypium australe TaxID=47621 RepID=A0A5B6VCM4_9ROSI|nr:Integrase, catalytic core [Gossypium australe]
MKEEETVKQYSNRIMSIVNSIRLLGDYKNSGKGYCNLPKRCEANISSLEDSRDLSSITLTELSMLFMLRSKEEPAYKKSIKKSRPTLSSSGYKGKKIWSDKLRTDGSRRRYPPCPHYKRLSHLEAKCCYSIDS